MRYVRTILAMLIIAAAFVLPTSSPAAGKTVGVVLSGNLPRYNDAYKAFIKTLRDAGYGEGKVTVYVQRPNPDPMSWTNSVRKFVNVGVDAIVAYGAPAAVSAVRETDSIPVVFSFVYDPAACGAKKNNSTGVNARVPMVTLLKTLKAIKPFVKLAVVYSKDDPGSVVQLGDVKKNSAALGFQVVEVGVKTASDVGGKVARAAGKSDSIYISCSAVAGGGASRIIKIANKKKIPAITQAPDLAGKGVLLALAPSAADQGEMAARQLMKVLKGDAPSDIAVASSRKVDLVLNLKAASALDLKVPFDVLNAATKVIK